MKRAYVRPTMQGEAFVANEYVAACYDIKCNVPRGYGYFEKNDKPGYQEREDVKIASGSGCGSMHQGVPGVPDDGPVANAMWQPTTWSGGNDGDPYPVFHWEQDVRGWGNSDHHFSKVDDTAWAPNPNAS